MGERALDKESERPHNAAEPDTDRGVVLGGGRLHGRRVNEIGTDCHIVCRAESNTMGRRQHRDARLDLWRGLCLVDVVLVHLAYNQLGFPEPLDGLIKHYTRFAAGGFVFLAGLTIATVFSPRVEGSAAERRTAHRWLWRRAAMLLVVDLCASAAYGLLDGARRFPVQAPTSLIDTVCDVALLRRPGLTGGILILYAVLLLAVPAVFALQRRVGRWAVATVSVALYIGALLATPLLHWPANSFPIAYWQPLFIAGFLWRDASIWLDAGERRRQVTWAMAVTAAFGLVFLAQHGPTFGVHAVARFLPLDFDKTPLRPGALLWYLTIVHVVLAISTLLRNRLLAGNRVAAALALLGRHSLLVYTAHVFTEAAVTEYVWLVWPPLLVRLGLVAADLVVLGALCHIAEARMASRIAAAVTGAARRFRPSHPRAALSLATAAAIIAVGLASLLREPTTT
ncbi:MAG: OpgC domain-containing protein, partial [bacterium]